MKLNNNIYRDINTREKLNKYLKGYSDIVKRLFDSVPSGEFALITEDKKPIGIQIKYGYGCTAQYKFGGKYSNSTLVRIVGNGKDIKKENVDVNAVLKLMGQVSRRLASSRGNKMKKPILNEFLMNIPKRICEKYNIEVPSDIANDFYYDMVVAIKGKPTVNSRQIKNEFNRDDFISWYDRQVKDEYKGVLDESALEAYESEYNNTGNIELSKSITISGNPVIFQSVRKRNVNNSRRIKSAKEECGEDACVLTPFGEIDRTVANADFTDESFKAYVLEPYAEENEDMMSDGLETKGE